jgi:tyrosine decarboxylase / aspartate 1-decarboxylase
MQKLTLRGLKVQLKGSSQKTVLEELSKLQALDQKYADGKILCSMCTQPHPIAKKAYEMFFNSNLGDLGLFPGSAQIEQEVIKDLATLLHGTNAAGFIVSGGTEANLMALLAARNKAQISEPEVILSQSAHFSFDKICSMLKIKPVYADLDHEFKVDVTTVEKSITKNTIAIIGTAGTAELGAVDPIDKLSTTAEKHNLWLHVDAAFGGLVLPFTKKSYAFDFGLRGVNSITVDPHKMGMAAIPAGGVLFRDKKMLNYVKTETPYLSCNVQHTFVGTRTGAAAASAWAVFRLLGIEGFEKTVQKCISNTRQLTAGLKKQGYPLLVQPTLNIVAFKSKNSKRLAEKLCRQGWFVSYIPRYDCIRVVLMPHTHPKHVKAFLAELDGPEKVLSS